MTTISPAPVNRPAASTPTTRDNSASALPIYRDDERSGPWTVGTRSVLGVAIGAIVGTVVLSWFGLVVGAAVGLGVGMLLDNRPAER
ncbi:glycine zipper domain-containing protein [Cellulosimicrobium marinum]|uniref:glycine zipper domain-containing protein n=1 Tax=Cellulosimicrobium marinum TaxID=1638992 RepID=UPI001E288424|nr:glycine zipper domain-containing protein [Cellulosimicrobium marinum]MCB7136594.1 hypothetical protein [Cellulosimicrobium marinum]